VFEACIVTFTGAAGAILRLYLLKHKIKYNKKKMLLGLDGPQQFQQIHYSVPLLIVFNLQRCLLWLLAKIHRLSHGDGIHCIKIFYANPFLIFLLRRRRRHHHLLFLLV
jgi:hypothetical protein